MANTEIEKREEKTSHLMDSLSKVLFGFIPGGHAAEVFLNYRQDLKSKRTLDFLENFSHAIQDFYGETEFDISQITNEDFVDVFDSIILKVQMTKSEMKIERFKQILLNQMVNPIEDYLIHKYVGLIEELNDIQIVMLKTITLGNNSKNINLIGSYFQPNDFDRTKIEANKTCIQIGGQLIEIEQSEVEYLFNDLLYKGLIEHEKREIRSFATSSYILDAPKDIKKEYDEIYSVSKFGVKFLSLIKEA